jgi:hypothetical protein
MRPKLMPHVPPDPRISRWLAAEARGEETAADRALTHLFAELPRPIVPEGFADRVMARVAADAARTGWKLEQVALGLLAACAGALVLLPRWLPGVASHLSSGALVSGLASLLVHLAHGVALLAPLWEGFVRVCGWVALTASSPQVLTAVALSTLLAAMAGRLLVALLDERSSGHAQVG